MDRSCWKMIASQAENIPGEISRGPRSYSIYLLPLSRFIFPLNVLNIYSHSIFQMFVHFHSILHMYIPFRSISHICISTRYSRSTFISTRYSRFMFISTRYSRSPNYVIRTDTKEEMLTKCVFWDITNTEVANKPNTGLQRLKIY